MPYYITYIDPRTGFLIREDFDSHAEWQECVRKLKRAGAEIATGTYRA